MNLKRKSIKKTIAIFAILVLLSSIFISTVPAFAAEDSTSSSVSDVVESSYSDIKGDIMSIVTNVVLDAVRIVLIVCVIVFAAKGAIAVRSQERANWIPFIVCLVALIAAWVLPEALLDLV